MEPKSRGEELTDYPLNRIINNNNYISLALDSIPLDRKVSKRDYENFVINFQNAFPDGGSGVAIASRLLAMKRPDHFVCLDKQNRSRLCEDFGISKTVSFTTYWDEIIERLNDSVWATSDRPNDINEVKAWSGRVAMVDVVYYEE